MSRSLLAVASLAAVVAGIPGVAAAQSAAPSEPAVSWGLEVAASSAYLWRGVTDIDGPSVQPSLWVTAGPLTVTSWVAGPDPGSGMRLREHDLTVEYAREFGEVEVAAGWAHYFFRYTDTDRQSQEVFTRVSHDSVLQPSIEVAHDFVLGRGTAVVVGIEPVFRATDRVRLGASVETVYNRYQWIDDSLWTHVEGRASMAFDATRRLVVRPYAGWSRSLNLSVLPSRAHGGIEISFSGRP
jgi:hypothetical protein